MPFRRATLTYSDGDNSVKVSGITADKVTLNFGDDGSDQYAALVNAGAFSDATSGHIYEEPGKGILASLRQNSACQYLLMNCDYNIPTLLLRFLGACVYGDVRAFYADLNESNRAELEKQGKGFGMTAWFYRYLYDVLPDERRAEYQKTYQMRQLGAITGAQELKRLYRVLTDHDLRFVPIKGADLAYRLYPDAALRPYGDWDIWFHPDDCKRALAVLAEDGWNVPKYYSGDHESVRKSEAHHFFPHVRGRCIVEPHFMLPNFKGIDLLEMWGHTADYPDGDGQRILSPEMNLLMLTRHAASKSYYHAQIPKLLTDTAMVLKDPVDFDVLRKLAGRWHLPYPGDLLAAFPEFFPAELIEKFGADPKKTTEFRCIFEKRAELGEQNNVLLLLSRYKHPGQIAKGIWKHIGTNKPVKMRHLYHLPEHGAWGRLAWSYVRWFWTRSLRAWRWIRRDPKLRDYMYRIETLESDAPQNK